MELLAARTANPLLRSILQCMIKDGRRHFSFYYNKVRMALESSRVQRLTTLLLKNFWRPVGSHSLRSWRVGLSKMPEGEAVVNTRVGRMN